MHSFLRTGGTQEMITKGIKKRNPKANSPTELTNAQEEDLEAAILKKMNGPHEPANLSSWQWSGCPAVTT